MLQQAPICHLFLMLLEQIIRLIEDRFDGWSIHHFRQQIKCQGNPLFRSSGLAICRYFANYSKAPEEFRSICYRNDTFFKTH